jgi:hypothetical protein
MVQASLLSLVPGHRADQGPWFTVFKSWITWERSLRFKYSATAATRLNPVFRPIARFLEMFDDLARDDGVGQVPGDTVPVVAEVHYVALVLDRGSNVEVACIECP